MKEKDINKLLQKVKGGDEVAFRALFMRYADRFYLWVNKIVDRPDQAQDIVQEFFVKFWERRSTLSFDSAASFQAYAYRSLFNMSLNHIRDNRKLQSGYDIILDIAEDPNTDPGAIEEFYRKMERSIEALPDRCKEIFKMAKIQRKSYEEIAAQLGISENTVKVQVSKAYRILRNTVN